MQKTETQNQEFKVWVLNKRGRREFYRIATAPDYEAALEIVKQRTPLYLLGTFDFYTREKCKQMKRPIN